MKNKAEYKRVRDDARFAYFKAAGRLDLYKVFNAGFLYGYKYGVMRGIQTDIGIGKAGGVSEDGVSAERTLTRCLRNLKRVRYE